MFDSLIKTLCIIIEESLRSRESYANDKAAKYMRQLSTLETRVTAERRVFEEQMRQNKTMFEKKTQVQNRRFIQMQEELIKVNTVKDEIDF